MKKKRPLMKAIEDQFHRTFEMWKEEIRNIPAKEWRKGEVEYLTPARHLCHLVVTADYYLSGKSPEEYDWSCYFGGDWESMSENELPAKSTALKKLSDFEKVMFSRLAQLNDEDLLEKEKQSPWTGENLAGKLLYLLRHSQHHVGEMHAELRHRGIKRASWR
jgi:uncharacterized damage-inducible protein DinB